MHSVTQTREKSLFLKATILLTDLIKNLQFTYTNTTDHFVLLSFIPAKTLALSITAIHPGISGCLL